MAATDVAAWFKRHAVLTALLDGVDFDGFVKFFAENVREIENFRNFVLG